MKGKLQRECRDHISAQLKPGDALNVLAEGKSLESYKRMRTSQSFETPQQKCEHPKKGRKHLPTFANVQWDKEGVLDRLRNWTTGKRVS